MAKSILLAAVLCCSALGGPIGEDPPCRNPPCGPVRFDRSKAAPIVTTLAFGVAKGDGQISVLNAIGVKKGMLVTISAGGQSEFHTVTKIVSTVMTLNTPLQDDYPMDSSEVEFTEDTFVPAVPAVTPAVTTKNNTKVTYDSSASVESFVSSGSLASLDSGHDEGFRFDKGSSGSISSIGSLNSLNSYAWFNFLKSFSSGSSSNSNASGSSGSYLMFFQWFFVLSMLGFCLMAVCGATLTSKKKKVKKSKKSAPAAPAPVAEPVVETQPLVSNIMPIQTAQYPMASLNMPMMQPLQTSSYPMASYQMAMPTQQQYSGYMPSQSAGFMQAPATTSYAYAAPGTTSMAQPMYYQQ